jgi:hypothetical protein
MTRRTKIAWIVGFVVLALVGSGVFFATRRTPQTLEYIIPKGTATQLLLGEPINIMPDRIDLSVGGSADHSQSRCREPHGRSVHDAPGRVDRRHLSPGRSLHRHLHREREQ